VYNIEEQKKILSLFDRLTSRKRDKHVNLLYVQDPQDDNERHFALIKDLSSWDRKLLDPRIRNISAIGKYNKKKKLIKQY